MEFLKFLSLLCSLLSFSQFGCAHIVLTFPPARNYPLDFLDNVRTPDPCGMPKGGSLADLVVGKEYTLTWSQAYPHKGDYAIELLDENEEVKTVLKAYSTPANATAYATILEHKVTVGAECNNCTIRLKRQADEWSAPLCGFHYEFKSCADVNIKNSIATEKKCTSTSRGTDNGSGGCTCNDRYYGPECQYEYECKTNSDCSNHGSCIIVNDMTTYRPRQCFCNAGWMGKKCEKESPVKAKITDFSSYTRESMHTAPMFDIFYKILTDTNEIEMIVRARTESWVGVGWRPADYMSGCWYFPTLNFPKPDPDMTTPVPEPVTTQAGCKPEPEGEAEPVTETEPNGEKYVNPTTGAKPHPMDCSDIVIGAVRGNQFSIGDYYTRDRSRPLRDEVYGGEDSLTAAFGYTENTETYIVFRKPLNATHRTDYTITTDRMNFIWARGQNYKSLSHKPDAGVSADSEYYKNDELKYHGTNEQRGHATLQFMGSDTSQSYSTGSYTSSNANFMVDWHYLDGSDSVELTMKFLNYDTSKWFGLGFSKDRSMVNTDAIIVSSSSSGVTVVTDRWISAKSRPPIDAQNDVKTLISANTDGTFLIKLLRKADTGDDKDIKLGSKDDCVYLLLAWGPKSGSGAEISRHTGIEISAKKYCIASDKVESDGDGLTSLEKIIIGVTAAVVAFCLILAMVLCLQRTINKGSEHDERKYRESSEYGSSVNKEAVAYESADVTRSANDASRGGSYYNKSYDSHYENKPMDVEFNSHDNTNYSDWVSSVNKGYPPY